MSSWKYLKLMYHRVVKSHHITLVQIGQTGLLMVTGDLIAQHIVERRKVWNRRRTLNFLIVATTFTGPAVALWYRFLAKSWPSPVRVNALKKMLCDQLVFAPSSLFLFLIYFNAIAGHDMDFIEKEIRGKYLSILLVNYSVWPFVQLFNFYVLPLKHQVLFAQTVGVLWNTYLTWKTNHE